ncbi:hypothetical protein A5893_09245 [Pedobacter psychrophilus]|uniref:Uncharacterized protein n=1 Tax=Pedobacter psychrophilus TaxID=1826909 RepID=A0A179DFC9_9SPHI|nr:hypothetical protein [Pedobacter psychrophilus]OAQ39756.1 hypothetical protein A5893_09245 [Pedobacter psychrophilus]
MKNKIFIFLSLFAFHKSFSQEKIITRYFSIDSIEVSKEKFQSLFDANRSNIVPANLKNQNDTMLVKLVNRKVLGQISVIQVNQIIQYFGRLDTSIATKKTLLIKYFQGDDPCSTSGSATLQSMDEYFANFEKQILKKYDVEITQVKTKNASVENRTNKPENWLTDKYSILYQFFPYHYSCGSFMILKPTGEYYIYYGEYGLQNALDGLKKLM